ncbi:MAG: acyltransferase family protein [Cyclobacteriaceae bacterium]
MRRRYDIDWLRVIAIGLLLIYHTAIGFQPWGVLIGFIQNSESLESIWIPLSILNIWRIPILFFVSGMGVYFAMRKRSWRELISERARRILLPFLFGMLAIVPLHILVWQYYYNQDLSYWVNPGHLWFLGNIFIYVLVLAPLFYYMKNNPNGRAGRLLHSLFKTPFGLIIIMIPFILETVIVRPDSFELYAMTLHGFVLGFLAFLTGFICVYSGESFWKTVTRWRVLLLSLSAILFMIRFAVFDLKEPFYLVSIESNLWIFTVFGFTHKYLDKPGRVLSYLSKAAYPVYIVHMIFLYSGSAILFQMEMSAWIKLLLLTVFTFAGSLGIYEFVLRRVSFLRPLFGLNASGRLPLQLKETGMKNTYQGTGKVQT